MNDKATEKIIFSALFAALVCVATMAVRIPTALGGYIHAGDAVVLLAAFTLGGGYGALAAGLGSALADVVSGFIIYAPATLVIKIVTALIAGALLKTKLFTKPVHRAIFAGLIAEAFMMLGYFAYECFVLKFGLAALGDLPVNAVQGLCGAAAAAALFAVLSKTKYFNKR